MIALTSFATEGFIDTQRGLAKSAIDAGAREILMWRGEDLKQTEFYRKHRTILDHPKGAGYWLWKPYIILSGLQQLRDGDFLVYCDSGRADNPQFISRPLDILTEWSRANTNGMLPGVYIPERGPNSKWTKGECFRAMGCEEDLYLLHPQIQATFSVWEKHSASVEFVRKWLYWCTVPAAVMDDHIDPSIPDPPKFRAHRHDQSILTLLALKARLRCFGLPWESHRGTKRINSLIDRITGHKPAISFAERFRGLAKRMDLAANPP